MTRNRLLTTFGIAAIASLLGAPAPAPAATSTATAMTSTSTALRLTSPAAADGGTLPVRYTCDGASVSPPLRWTGVPKGTRSFAVVMHHEATDGVHVYLVDYAIPASARALPEDLRSHPFGRLGVNTVNGRAEYTPPCSKGPGPKQYTITLYALGATPSFPAGSAVTRDVLLRSTTSTTLAATSITVTVTRAASTSATTTTVTAATGSSDARAVTGWIYADNWFQLYVNGDLAATDPTPFKPFEVVPVSFTATLPMTIAIIAKDYADPVTGLEYDNTKVGDGGLIVHLSNGTVSSTAWKAKVIERGPLNLNDCLAAPSRCVVEKIGAPTNWTMPGFDDSGWGSASQHTRDDVQPHADDFDRYDWTGSQFIWGPDLLVDNTVLFRTTITGR